MSKDMLSLELIRDLEELNPWLRGEKTGELVVDGEYIPRLQEEMLLDPEWDRYWLLLVGPRRAGKTTLGNWLCRELLKLGRVDESLYISCDFASVRAALTSPSNLAEIIRHFKLTHPVIFIDEAQRLENSGLILKGIIDLKLNAKLIASGSSQLELKNEIQEYLTGREIEVVILPLSDPECRKLSSYEERFVFGSYPQVIQSRNRKVVLSQLYRRYIEKDIIEILRLSKPDVMERLITLIAHSTGQLVNYQQLANDCKVSIPTVQSYLGILEKTYVIKHVTPFVGNKRSEITSNPKYYFIDNGFRNQALRNFNSLEYRGDIGQLAEGYVFQEILKCQKQHSLDFDIHYWRTKGGAEVDFILYWNPKHLIPIEVKYRSINKPTISRGFRSFIDAYKPKIAILITKDYIGEVVVNSCKVLFIPISRLDPLFDLLNIDNKQT